MTDDDKGKGVVCGFCGDVVGTTDHLALRLTLTNLRCGGGRDDPSQEIYSHSACLSTRLIADVCFDPEAFLPDEATG